MTDAPDLTIYRAVHHGLRQGADDLVVALAGLDVGDRRRTRALARWWRGYAGEVLLHHGAEDTVFFPALVDRVPAVVAVLDRTAADHEHLDELLDGLTASMGSLSSSSAAGEPTGAEVARQGALALAVELARHMDEHLDLEDVELLPLFESHLTVEEYEALDAAAMKSAGSDLRQLAFSLPYVVAAIAPADLPRVLASAPLMMRVVLRLTHRSHARLVAAAFGGLVAGGELRRREVEPLVQSPGGR